MRIVPCHRSEQHHLLVEDDGVQPVRHRQHRRRPVEVVLDHLLDRAIKLLNFFVTRRAEPIVYALGDGTLAIFLGSIPFMIIGLPAGYFLGRVIERLLEVLQGMPASERKYCAKVPLTELATWVDRLHRNATLRAIARFSEAFPELARMNVEYPVYGPNQQVHQKDGLGYLTGFVVPSSF